MRVSSPSRRTTFGMQGYHLQSGSRARAGFTLIELAVVILVILILAALTISMVGNVMDGDRVRGASRQVQNYLAGARDRAIYAASRMESEAGLPPAIGVRFLPNPSLIQGTTVRGFGSMVFIQEVEPIPTRLYLYFDTTDNRWEVSQIVKDESGALVEGLERLPNRSIQALIDRGLIGSQLQAVNPVTGATPAQPVRVYYLPVYFDRDASGEVYYVTFVDGASFGGPGNQWLTQGLLSKPFALGTQGNSVQTCRLRLLPSPMPNEEPRILPSGTTIDVQSSVVAGVQLSNLVRADGSFDIMFNSQGVVEGPLAATGLIHLAVVDIEDLERGFRLARYNASGNLIPGSPFVDNSGVTYTGTGSPPPADSDGDGNYDERQGEVSIVSLRTQTGSAYSSDLNPVPKQSPPPNPFAYEDPFLYAEAGGEAK